MRCQCVCVCIECVDGPTHLHRSCVLQVYLGTELSCCFNVRGCCHGFTSSPGHSRAILLKAASLSPSVPACVFMTHSLGIGWGAVNHEGVCVWLTGEWDHEFTFSSLPSFSHSFYTFSPVTSLTFSPLCSAEHHKLVLILLNPCVNIWVHFQYLSKIKVTQHCHRRRNKKNCVRPHISNSRIFLACITV